MNKALENLKLYIAPFGLPENDFDELSKSIKGLLGILCFLKMQKLKPMALEQNAC